MRITNIKIGVLSVFCGLASVVQANSYRYQFIPASGSSVLPGSYLDLNAASGSGAAVTSSILDWHIVTPSGILNNSDSFETPILASMSWSTSKITSLDVLFWNYVPGNATELTQGTENLYYPLPSSTGNGAWKLVSSSVPESADTLMLLGMAMLGLAAFCWFRKPARAKRV